jgi:hypothetical protein
MLISFSFLMSVLHNQCCTSLKDYKIVAKIFDDNYWGVKYFDKTIRKVLVVLSVACNYKQKYWYWKCKFSSRMANVCHSWTSKRIWVVWYWYRPPSEGFKWSLRRPALNELRMYHSVYLKEHTLFRVAFIKCLSSGVNECNEVFSGDQPRKDDQRSSLPHHMISNYPEVGPSRKTIIHDRKS